MSFLRIKLIWSLVAATLLGVCGCYELSGPSGGGEISPVSRRAVDAADVQVPPGYHVEVVAEHLNFPTSVAFDDADQPYVIESGYCYGEVWTTPRLVRVERGGRVTEIARGDAAPWTGVSFYRGNFYVAEGGEERGGRIVRIGNDGRITPIVENLPSMGDHHTNGPVIGADGSIYFSIGTATNSGVVGEDNFRFGWAKRYPEFHDIPGKDITLSGENFESEDPIHGGKVVTGAYLPFGVPSVKGQVIRGQVPCSGGVFRIPPGSQRVELMAWGLRNPFGLAFGPDGNLYTTENSFDVRGSRPVWGAGDCLYRIEKGMWYGWPDFHAGQPLTWEKHYKAPFAPALTFLLASHPNKPPKPAAVMGVHASSCGFDFSRSPAFGHLGEAFVAEFGDMSPGVGKVIAPVGFKVVRVNVADGVIHDFAINKGEEYGPGSYLKNGGLERPVAARFDRSGTVLYVVDFGILRMEGDRARPVQNSGVLWRIAREGRR